MQKCQNKRAAPPHHLVGPSRSPGRTEPPTWFDPAPLPRSLLSALPSSSSQSPSPSPRPLPPTWSDPALLPRSLLSPTLAPKLRPRRRSHCRRPPLPRSGLRGRSVVVPLIGCPDCGDQVKFYRSSTDEHDGWVFYRCSKHTVSVACSILILCGHVRF